VPVVANVPARAIKEPAEIVQKLVEQVTATVRWRESVMFMAQSGVSSFFEIGAGRVLTGLIKRIVETASATAIGLPEDVVKFKAARA
jgi:[acyl-carrier-protein] S-malonyltransferase